MSDWWKVAEAMARSAHALHEIGDYNSAIDRAYYAMFDAARAALADVDPALADGKTHHGTIRRFSQHMIKTGYLPERLGRSLNVSQSARLAAMYEPIFSSREECEQALTDMEEFLAHIGAYLRRPKQ